MPRSLTFSALSRGEFFSFVNSDGETFLKVDNQHFEDAHQRRYKIHNAGESVERHGHASGRTVLRTEYESDLYVDGRPSKLTIRGVARTEDEFRKNARKKLASNVRLVGKLRIVSRTRVVKQ